MQILVVEDDIRLADALSQILREQKYMVDLVYDGQDGLDYACSGIYDVIILDVMLPEARRFFRCFGIKKAECPDADFIAHCKGFRAGQGDGTRLRRR